MARPWDLQVGRSLKAPSFGDSGMNPQTARLLPCSMRARPSLGLLPVTSTPPCLPASAAATAPPPDWGTYLKGFVFARSWMRRKRTSSSCFAPVPDPVISRSWAPFTKSCAVLIGLSAATQRKNGSCARLALGVKSGDLYGSFCVVIVVQKLLG